MNEEQAVKLYEDMLEHFGWLPNPVNYPRTFQYYVKMYKYQKGIK